MSWWKGASGAANETSLRAKESSINSSKAFDGYANERTSEQRSKTLAEFGSHRALDHRKRMEFAENAITLRKCLP